MFAMLLSGRKLSYVPGTTHIVQPFNKWSDHMKAMWNNIQKFLRNEEGVTAIEYALIAALIAVVIIAAVTFVGNEVNETFTTVGDALNNANGT